MPPTKSSLVLTGLEYHDCPLALSATHGHRSRQTGSLPRARTIMVPWHDRSLRSVGYNSSGTGHCHHARDFMRDRRIDRWDSHRPDRARVRRAIPSRPRVALPSPPGLKMPATCGTWSALRKRSAIGRRYAGPRLKNPSEWGGRGAGWNWGGWRAGGTARMVGGKTDWPAD